MRVCHFIEQSFKGDYFKHISKGLTQHGHEVILVELGDHDPPLWLNDVPGVRYVSFGIKRKTSFPVAVIRLARFVSRERIDILHAHLFNSGLIAALTRYLQRTTRVVIMRHHTGVVRMLGSRLHIAADKWMAETADHVLTVSEAARRYMLDVDQIRRRDIEVVHLGFDFSKFKPDRDIGALVREEYGFRDSDLVIGYVANLLPGKGHKQLLEAFAETLRVIPRARLWFIGRGDLPDVREAIEQFPSGTVVLGGWRDDISACLNAMDMFVQPSLTESFGQSLVEAIACGVPAISTLEGIAPEILEDDQLVPAGDVEGLAQKIIQLCSESELRASMADRAMRTVQEKLGIDQMVDGHIRVYRKWMEHTDVSRGKI
jgi:glycosyltransferase involved in cell wall biosynthesis